MTHRTCVVLLVAVVSLAPAPLRAQDPAPAPPSPALILQSIQINGVTLYLDDEIARRAGLEQVGQGIGRSAEEIAEAVRQVYREDGFTLATVNATLDETTGRLTISVDEGRFDDIRLTGLDEGVAPPILERLALRTGEVFNVSQANRALDDALTITEGAVQRAEPTFQIVADAGRRVLQIALRQRSQRGGAFAGTQGREDWYSPVDALSFAIGAQGTIFDRGRFTNTHWSGYVSRKFGPDRFGYSFGIERALLPQSMLQIGGSIQDITATDDDWRLGDAEQSLVALLFRNTFRDYYRRKGFQVHAALTPAEAHELVVAWRDESHGSLANETNYGVFRDSHVFRANRAADPGDLRALVLGYTFDSRGAAGGAPEDRYRRHLLDSLFGDEVEREPGFRVEWRSEIAPGAFGHDFDFARHVVQARGWWTPSSGRGIGARVIAGGSSGTLPAQRVFALGGIGSVHGYRFKEQAGDGMVLLNGEFRQQLGGSEFAGLVFLDVGRVYGATPPGPQDPAYEPGAWMRGVGVGLEFDGGARVEFGWRLNEIPGSLQVLFRLRPSF